MHFMGNHFHLLLEIPDREVALGGLSDEDVLARLDLYIARRQIMDLR